MLCMTSRCIGRGIGSQVPVVGADECWWTIFRRHANEAIRLVIMNDKLYTLFSNYLLRPEEMYAIEPM